MGTEGNFFFFFFFWKIYYLVVALPTMFVPFASPRLSIHNDTSVGVDGLSGNVTAIRTREKNEACGHLAGLSRTTDRDAAELFHCRSEHG